MKKVLILFSVFSVLSCSLFADWVVDPATLPAKAKSFISANFADAQIFKVKRDDGRFDVKLSNGVEIDFTPDGEWLQIESSYNAIPMGVLPNAIVSSIKKTYPEATVIEVKKRYGNYKIKLNNFMELYMSSNGQIVNQRWDD